MDLIAAASFSNTAPLACLRSSIFQIEPTRIRLRQEQQSSLDVISRRYKRQASSILGGIVRHLSVSFAVALMLSTAAITPAPASTILAPGGLAAAESRAGVDIVDASELRGRSWIAIVVLAGLAALTIYLLTDARPRSRSARHNGFSGYRLTATVPGERRSLRLVLGRADPVLPRRASAPRDGK